jgi:hypothetical protein
MTPFSNSIDFIMVFSTLRTSGLANVSPADTEPDFALSGNGDEQTTVETTEPDDEQRSEATKNEMSLKENIKKLEVHLKDISMKIQEVQSKRDYLIQKQQEMKKTDESLEKVNLKLKEIQNTLSELEKEQLMIKKKIKVVHAQLEEYGEIIPSSWLFWQSSQNSHFYTLSVYHSIKFNFSAQ